ncbi:MAG: hypothetical protein Q7U04_12055 [Bacteriovorax sp.]|nr:hypothetical protein [Bacteriovorax sp.]
MDLVKRFFISLGIFVGGIELVYRFMLANGIRPPGFFMNLVDAIHNVILFVLVATAIIAVLFIIMTAAQTYFEAKEKEKERQRETEREKAKELIWEKDQKEKLQKQIEKDEKDRQCQLKLERRRLAEIKYQKTRSAKEATNDSLSDFL